MTVRTTWLGSAPVDRVIDRLWGEEPPVSAAARVRALVAELRRALADDGARFVVPQSPATGCVSTAGHARRRGVRQAGGGRGTCRGDGRHEDAVALFNKALDLWRGAPLDGLTGAHLAVEVARLTEQRAAALKGRAEALLELHPPHNAVVKLGRVVAEHPLREKPHGLLMLALYRSGRPAEALRVYQRFRDRLCRHPHTLSFLSTINRVPALALCVTRFGQSDSIEGRSTRPPRTSTSSWPADPTAWWTSSSTAPASTSTDLEHSRNLDGVRVRGVAGRGGYGG